ncbi:MAG: hypothetical protein JEZ00_02965 [Anaerolineaceae bacterium]|nr:hypothetical protein [Anaerolineaceae bacterium]
MEKKKSVPWFLWPFKLIWDLLAFILNVTGRIVGAVLGLVLLIVGLLLTILIFAAPIGIPLMVFGFMLMIRSLF